MGETREKVGNAIAGIFGCLWQIGLSLFVLGGWVTHIVVCFQRHYYGFLIAGAILFPIAVIHGWGLWFGWWH
jgi:hypothetical protein